MEGAGGKKEDSKKGVNVQLNGNVAKNEVIDLSSEIDTILMRQKRERRESKLGLIPNRRKGFIAATHAEFGKIYSISIEENGIEKMTKAEFLTKGRRDFLDFVFFRRTLVGGKIMIQGIRNYSLIKEVGYDYKERE